MRSWQWSVPPAATAPVRPALSSASGVHCTVQRCFLPVKVSVCPGQTLAASPALAGSLDRAHTATVPHRLSDSQLRGPCAPARTGPRRFPQCHTQFRAQSACTRASVLGTRGSSDPLSVKAALCALAHGENCQQSPGPLAKEFIQVPAPVTSGGAGRPVHCREPQGHPLWLGTGEGRAKGRKQTRWQTQLSLFCLVGLAAAGLRHIHHAEKRATSVDQKLIYCPAWLPAWRRN